MGLEYSPPTPENLLFLRKELRKAVIAPIDGARNLNCYFTARAAASEHGGTILDVWEIAEVPNCFLHFRPHVLWKKASGEVIDPSPSEFGFSATTYFESTIPHNLPMPASYLYPLTDHPTIKLNCKIQNIAYKFISEKLNPEKPAVLNKSEMLAECAKRLEEEDIYSSDNMNLLLTYIIGDTKIIPLRNN